MLKRNLYFLLILSLLGCSSVDKQIMRDLSQIKENGRLTAITGYSATSYFIYRGQPMGYEYELLERLADHLGVEIEIRIAKDMDQIFDMLNTGQGDIIAHSMAVTKQRTKRVAFTKPHLNVSMALVQRKPDKWRKMKLHEIEKRLIRNPIDLIGKKVHVRRESSYYARLHNLSEEIGGDVEIIESPGKLSTDELIQQVANGKIAYTIADENIALINQAYYSNIDTKTKISLPQQISWVVRKNSPQLLEAVNTWIDSMKNRTEYYVIYNKYFKNRTAFRERAKSEYFSAVGGGISSYDSTIQAQAQRLNWDWRLLASQIFQESQFDSHAKSWSGAVGLMQLMPRTAAEFGAKNLYDPLESIEVGVNYLIWLDDYWKDEISDSVERLKFILGSYNVGYNHIADARRLAEKNGKEPDIWDGNIAECLLMKSKKEYFNDEVVKFGYCRGEEPVKYVAEIEERYEHYLKLLE